jgi:RNA polymerase sigma-70 factor, ECF subfamily
MLAASESPQFQIPYGKGDPNNDPFGPSRIGFICCGKVGLLSSVEVQGCHKVASPKASAMGAGANDLPTEELRSSEIQTNFHALDMQFVARLLLGEPTAWQQFIDKYGQLIRSRVADVASSFGFANDEAAIDDATAEIFASLLANNNAAIRAYAGRSALSTYLCVITTRVATRLCARRKGILKNQSNDANLLESLSDDASGQDPASSLVLSEQRESVLRILDELPLKQREVVRLFHLEGQTYADISRVLNMPIGSVGVTLSRAEAKLREKLLPPDEI